MNNEWKYIIDKDNKNRFLLGQIKDITKDTILWFGINPSTATPDKLDNTIKKIIKISKNNNYDNWLVANIYPKRATNPDLLDENVNKELHLYNLEVIKRVLEEYKNITIVFAYGNIITIRDYLNICLNDIKNLINQYNVDIKIIDYTKQGHPKHPLYAKDDVVLKSIK